MRPQIQGSLCDICRRPATWQQGDAAYCALHEPIGPAVAGARVRPSPLTSTQCHLLALLAQDRTQVDVVRVSGLSRSTVQRHMADIRERLGVSTIHGAIVVALQEGYLRLDELELYG